MRTRANKGVYTVENPLIVTGEWLVSHLDDPHVVPVDVRAPHFFAQGHLPRAVNLPAFFVQGQSGGPLASDEFARHLGNLGISRDTHVVVYDDGASPPAAVLFLVLQYYRHPFASVLDGGISKWLHESRGWEQGATAPSAAEYFPGEPDDGVLATFNVVRHSLDDPHVALVDVRSSSEYFGLQMSAARNGHIPGAVNVEWSTVLTRTENAIIEARTESELRALYTSAGITPDKTVIVYCQSGSRSSHTYLFLKSLGYPDVRNYMAGWQEWGNRDDTLVDDG